MKYFSFIIFSLILCICNLKSKAQILRFQDLIKIVNTDDKQVVIDFLKGKGFLKEKEDDLFEYYKYYKFGKHSNDSGNGRVILWKRSSFDNFRKVSFATPSSYATKEIYKDLINFSFKEDYSKDLTDTHPEGFFTAGTYKVNMTQHDEMLWDTMEILKVGSCTFVREDKRPWN